MTNRFKKINKTGILFITMACMYMLSGCMEKDVYEGPIDNAPTKDDFFDFSTTDSYTLDVNYGLNNYPVLFELYTSDPMTITDGRYTKADNVRAVYRAATDNAGKFKGEITLPTYATTVYLYCSYLGTVRCAELTINGSTISFDQDTYLAELSTRSGVTTRATTSQGYTIPDGYLTLGGWNPQGKPNYLSKGEKLSGDFLSRLTKAVVKDETHKNANFVAAHPSPDINITASTKLSTVIVYSDASKEVTVGYFTYPTGQAPASPADIKNPILLFPAVSSSTGNADIGDEVEMKYWNTTTGKFEDEFPAGVSVSFFFMVEAFEKNKGDIQLSRGNSLEEVKLSKNVDYIFYSNSSLNQKLPNAVDAQRTITMSNDGLAAICFEADLKKAFTSGSWDYTDVIMTLRYSESATDTEMPKLPSDKEEPKDEDNFVDYWGTLAFEDLWPSQGDYDMNDVSVYYESIIYKSVANNNIVKIVDKFYTAHRTNGASKINGFGYQFHKIATSAVSNVTIETDGSLATPGLEEGQDHPTIIVFDNGKEAAKEVASFTVTTTFNGGVPESDVRPPYNPFIVTSMNSGRGIEVHLTNYPPTKLANAAMFGNSDDKSSPSIGLYYVSNNNFPYAIHLSHAYMELPAEGVRIDKVYPNFANWADSKGVSNKSWYVK